MNCPHGMTPEQWKVSAFGCKRCIEDVSREMAECAVFGHDVERTRIIGKLHNGRAVAECDRCGQFLVLR